MAGGGRSWLSVAAATESGGGRSWLLRCGDGQQWRDGAGPLVVEPQQLRVYPLIALLSRVGDGLQGRQGGTHKEVFEAIDVEGRAGVESRGRLVDGELGKRELAVPVVLLSFA